MPKRRETTEGTIQRITMPDEFDLSSFDSLQLTFRNGKGTELCNIQFRRETDGSAELAINIIGPSGEVSTAVTLFDLPA